MNVSALARRLASLVALCGVALALSACMITSETSLLAEGEGATPLPATFHFFTYTDKEGAIVRTEDEPMFFTLGDDNLYADAAGTMKVAFVPLAENDQTYLMSVATSDGSLYGLARYADGLMEIRMVLGGDVAAELQAAGATDVTVEDDGITIADRETLDLVVGLIAEGKLTTAPLIGFIAESADATVPAAIVAEGDWYRAG
jgi:hypothetical protein